MTEERARSHPKVLAGERYARKFSRVPGGWGTESFAVIRAAKLRYRQRHKDRVKVSAAKWRKANPEKCREISRNWDKKLMPSKIKANIRYDATQRGVK